jgi:hypothetical protein
MVDAHDASNDERFDDGLDASVRSAYRGSQARDPAAEARVLERTSIRREARPGWWFETHLFELRPAPIVALAAVTLVASLWAGSQLTPRARRMPAVARHAATATAPAGSPGVPVTFVLHTAEAARVNLVGDFNSWDANATPLVHDGSRDLWVVELEVPRGMHNYAFVVDGREWQADPSAPLAAAASFGGPTSVLVVEGPGL